MRCRTIAAASLVLAGLSFQSARAQEEPVTLKVGDPAPALSVGKWVKGEPVEKIEKGKLYVVEFWATWCGPCRATIPHLSEMAKKNPDIVFIGQDVWERDESLVEPFVKEMGDKMSYRVATDSKPGQDGDMSKNWMRAAGQNGIPTAFLVDKESKIAWIGHPMELDAVLEKVKQGTYDVKAAAAEKEKVTAINKKISTAMRAKDIDGALAATKELAELKPEMADKIAAFEYRVLTQAGRTEDAKVRAEKIVTSSKDAETLNAIAWGVATGKTPAEVDLKLARRAIDRANEQTEQKVPNLLDTSARVYALEKNWEKAVEQQTKAISLAEGDMKAELQKTLDAYKKQEVPPAE